MIPATNPDPRTGPDAGGFQEQLRMAQARIERVLEEALATRDTAAPRLHAAMRYGVLDGGKRLRPLLVYITGAALGASMDCLDAPAAAVELIHAYSLIHDDLPAMDDDDLRRGRPSCHRAFDEGTAILAGDALQALAFGVLARGSARLTEGTKLQMLIVLAEAIGTEGMAGGQALDLDAAGGAADATSLEQMHRRKTGALIRASVLLGALAAGPVGHEVRDALRRYGDEIGLAFQIQDDILDVTGETMVLGKRTGADAARGKPSYPSVFGLERARELALEHRDRALAALTGMGTATASLRALAHYVVDRVH
ncbi:MAG TPA: (2E,6E)-farnesyl diphosphate synthase [Steroidobacteraceae bacterium]|nr:(2E,6E)-farnesyl diphosphate synthase [Steroidobacteraceae bacterium]